MDISLIFKIAAVGILVSILSQVLKHSGREEQAFLASLAGLILVLSWVLPFNETKHTHMYFQSCTFCSLYSYHFSYFM